MTDLILNDKAALVTGAGSGIGRAIAQALLERGAQVTTLHRTPESVTRCADAVAPFAARHRAEIVDLSDLTQIRALVARLPEAPIDLLLQAAAVQPWTRRSAADGTELTWATNVRAPFLLTELLAPRLAGGQVLSLSSMVHKWAQIHWSDLQQNVYDPNAAYYQSKLALMLLSRDAARRHPQIRINTMHPGMTRSNFARDFKGFYRFMARLTRPFQRRPEDVASEALRIAFDPRNSAVSGAYFVRGKVAEPAPQALDTEAAARLWRICAQECGLGAPEGVG